MTEDDHDVTQLSTIRQGYLKLWQSFPAEIKNLQRLTLGLIGLFVLAIVVSLIRNSADSATIINGFSISIIWLIGIYVVGQAAALFVSLPLLLRTRVPQGGNTSAPLERSALDLGESEEPSPLSISASRSPTTGDAVGSFDMLAAYLMADLIQTFTLQDYQAAGVVGNIGAECGGFTELQEQHPISPPGGYGWCRWTGTRRRAFFSFCGNKGLDADSYAANFAFLVKELQSPQNAVLSNVQAASTIEDATNSFLDQFEKPRRLGFGPRVRYAQQALAAFSASSL